MHLTPQGQVLSQIAMDGETFPQEQIDWFVQHPEYYHEFVKEVEAYTNAKFKAVGDVGFVVLSRALTVSSSLCSTFPRHLWPGI